MDARDERIAVSGVTGDLSQGAAKLSEGGCAGRRRGATCQDSEKNIRNDCESGCRGCLY